MSGKCHAGERIKTSNGTILVKRWLLVTGDGNAPALLDAARRAALLAMPVFVSHWGILTTDQHGVDAEVARICEAWAIAYRVIGTTAAPSNGARHYMRLVSTATTSAARRAERDAFLVAQASRIICVGRRDTITAAAARLGKPVEIRPAVPVPA